jgi:Apea-like HEPN
VAASLCPLLGWYVKCIIPLIWVKEKWLPSGELLKNQNFYAALKSFDFATLHGRTSGSLLALWGALETLFSPARSELRFRVASLLSSYLEPSGDKRRDLYKRILGLYDQRSAAAHTAQEPEIGSLVETYVLARNALVRMVDDCRIPSQSDLEGLLFGSKSE